jgi:glucan 1,3-beta-glucosidase
MARIPLILALCTISSSGQLHGVSSPSCLHAAGTQIVDEAGQPVVLRGVNLGGWLVEEMWMMPFQTRPAEGSELPEVKDHVSLWRTIEKRLGTVERDRLRTALRRAWIDEADFDRIKAAGLNCVRLPFLHDMLDEPDGFSWIDQALVWARARGLYVILDLHGAPGRQSGEHHTGETGIDRLFEDEAHSKAAENVWKRVASRYRDHPEVAAYDLVNEPMGAHDAAAVYALQDRLYRAIRAVDDRHMIIIEDGYKGIDSFPQPRRMGWSNVVYSTHHYRFDAKTSDDQDGGAVGHAEAVEKLSRDRQVPHLVGEFQFEPHGNAGTLAKFIKELESRGHSWTIWTYKTAMKDGGGGMWGWHRAAKRLDPLDPFRDTPDAFLRKLALVKTENLHEDRAMTAAFHGLRE